jgi:hypothetical protein
MSALDGDPLAGDAGDGALEGRGIAMTIRQRTALAVLFVLVGVGTFVAGIWVGDYRATHPQIYVADGYVGQNVASFDVGGTTYGLRSSVNWTDKLGAFHDGGWPDCLPRTQAVTGVRLAVATLWTGDVGEAQVVWIDCQGR